MNEPNESKTANLLAGMDDLPENDWAARIDLLIEILEEQDQEIQELKRKLNYLSNLL